jgi:hypothetical protein
MVFHRFHGLSVFHHFSEFLAHFLALGGYLIQRKTDRTLWRKELPCQPSLGRLDRFQKGRQALAQP